jgi:hypothetical protein
MTVAAGIDAGRYRRARLAVASRALPAPSTACAFTVTLADRRRLSAERPERERRIVTVARPPAPKPRVARPSTTFRRDRLVVAASWT